MHNSTTPVPNYFFDVHLKTLKSAELKVLLVITRQTYGWEDKKTDTGRKKLDWISGSQLQSRTGCSKRAISSAIDVLVRNNLIKVFDDKGNQLYTPEQRQGKIRLYYHVCSLVENQVNITPTSAKIAQDISKIVSELVQKMHITKLIPQN